MKILVIRLSSIGDIVLTSPVLRCIKKKYPHCEIHYLTKKPYAAIVQHNPNISKLHFLRKSIGVLIEELKRENFDQIIDLHNNVRTLRIKKGLDKVPAHSFNKLNIQKWLLTNFKVNIMPHIHIVERYMETVKPLGVYSDGLGLDYFIAPEEEVAVDDIPTTHMHGYVGVVIGAAHNTKKLPVEKLIELCSKINHPILLLGGKDDIEAASNIVNVDPIKIYSACGKFTINESADLVRKAKVIVTHDTGLMHIAAAYKKKTISIWGNTVPAFGMYPYKTDYEVAEVKKLWCRPCSKIGHRKCPLGHFKCMKKQDIDQLVNSVHQYLNINAL